MSALPGVFALMGVNALAWVQANDQQNQQKSTNDVDIIYSIVSKASE